MAELAVSNLKMYYRTRQGHVRAVDDVSFVLASGRALGIVGESGCGKSSLGLTLLRLLPPNGEVVGGSIRLGGQELLTLDDETFRKSVRWTQIAMVFQGAMNALNPVLTVGSQIAEAILAHEPVSREEAVQRAKALLEMVGINPARYDHYPHEFSGGMKQRAVIAMALACNPQVIIADEPTTALDVMVQAQVLQAIAELREQLGLSMILVSHDLSVVAQTCDEVAVMYAGKIVEYGPVEEIFLRPKHPYTQGLVQAFPDIHAERAPIVSIPGTPPNLLDPPSGCRFHPRCPLADQQCRQVEPELVEKGRVGHRVACHQVSPHGEVAEVKFA
ncbi:MAG TPA: ABC transporter ATP-binding protein [Sphingobacteriaceae bacterium]|nr:ABC transporter ATP-binding protein [Sphingobacteriaceae bacterium]